MKSDRGPIDPSRQMHAGNTENKYCIALGSQQDGNKGWQNDDMAKSFQNTVLTFKVSEYIENCQNTLRINYSRVYSHE
jgi:hypothetical protein